MTIKSNEKNFQKHFAGSGIQEVKLIKETVGSAEYLTSAEYYLDAKKSMGGGVWQGIFYLKGMGFRTIKITLKDGDHCEIQPGLSVEEGIKFPQNLKITGSLELNAGKILPKDHSTTGMPTYTKQFFAAVKSDSLKTKWVDDDEVETFTYYRKDQENMKVTEIWKGSSQLFKTKADKVYYKKVYKVDGSGNFVPSSENTFEIFIPEGTALPAIFH